MPARQGGLNGTLKRFPACRALPLRRLAEFSQRPLDRPYFILHKIKEVDEFFASAPPNCTRLSVRCIRSVLLRTGRAPVVYSKKRQPGRKERVQALSLPFSDIDVIVNDGRKEGLPLEDILDATVACWSALRLAGVKGEA